LEVCLRVRSWSRSTRPATPGTRRPVIVDELEIQGIHGGAIGRLRPRNSQLIPQSKTAIANLKWLLGRGRNRPAPSKSGEGASTHAPAVYSAASSAPGRLAGASEVVLVRRLTKTMCSQFEHSNARTSPNIRQSGRAPKLITASHSGQTRRLEVDIMAPSLHRTKSNARGFVLVQLDLVQ
jgi:hypothetical protein